jgi:glycosyltransferase involved in cell wall biosynthesis
MRHEANLPAPIRVMTLDLDRPIVPIEGCAGLGALRVLVRDRGVPVAWLTIEHPPATIEVDAIERLLVDRVGTELRVASLRRALEPLGNGTLPPMSVVVCTRDRTASLERCLASLRALDYPTFEVIVVDNAPATRDTEMLVARAGWTRYVREDRPGLDWARNRGIAAARHEIVAFTDDDVRVDPAWLRGIAHGFADDSTMLVTGFVAPAELDSDAQVMFELGYGGMGKGFSPVEWGRDPLPHRGLGAHHLGVGANMAFRRAVFDRIGTFETTLDVGTPSRGGGDLDMFHRVLVSGALARYEPRALVWHSHRREMPALHRQLRDNGRGFGVYLMTCAARGTVRRAAVARYAIFVWMRWLGGRVVRRLVRREVLSLPLQLEEIRGAVSAPLAYLATRRRDAAIRAGRGAS